MKKNKPKNIYIDVCIDNLYFCDENLKEFILEGWDDIPPMRRDFNTRKYVKDVYDTEDRTEQIFKPRWEKYE